MSSNPYTTNPYYDPVPARSESPWWLGLLGGIAAIIIGFLFLSSPGMTMAIIIQFLGFYWLFTGVLGLVSLFVDRTDWVWKVISGILGIIAGFIVIENPLWSAVLIPATLILMLGIGGLIIGVAQIISAFRGGGFFSAVLGILSIIFGLILLFHPVAGGLATPWVLGVLAIAGGIITITMSFMTRSRQHASTPPPMPA